MRADAIIFDKDGTLLDFDSFWVTVTVNAMEQVLKKLGRSDIPVSEILEALGVHDGATDMDGALCKGTYEEIGHIVQGILNAHGCDIASDNAVEFVINAYNQNADTGEIKPTCPDLAEVLAELKKRGKRLALVTTDNEEITRKCLDGLGIAALFDRIYTDDGKTPTKPDPYCAVDFCAVTGVEKACVVMVGDTMTDVRFARNAGISVVGVAKTEKNGQALAPHADAVISRITDLLEFLQ